MTEEETARLLVAQREELEMLRRQLAQLLEQLAVQNTRIAELVAMVQRKGRAPAPPTKPPAAPSTLDDAAREAFDKRPRPPELPPKVKPAGPKRPPTGRKPVPDHLEAEEHLLRPDACAQCGSNKLDVADTLVEEKLHVVKEHVRRRVVTRITCRCPACGERTTPRSLPAPYTRSKITCEFLAWLVHSKFAMLTPLDRTRRDLKERDVSLATATLVGFIERAADLLAAIDGYHWQQLLAGPWMATDGTSLKVLVKGAPTAHNGYLELYRNDECAVFQYEATKESAPLESKLAKFTGTLTADAENRFDPVFKSGEVVEAGCNAHARRKFRDAEATQPVLAAEGGQFISAIYIEENEAQKLGLTGDALRERRRTRITPILEEFDKWREATEPSLLPSEPLAQAIRYYDNHRDALYRFVDDPHVPIDNSPTEREFQNVAKLRFNMLFAGSTEGAHRACVLLGIVATCRAVGVPIQAYLAWAFERLGTHRDLFDLPIHELTPAAFKKTLKA